jgi:RHS repeat-associated protein
MDVDAARTLQTMTGRYGYEITRAGTSPCPEKNTPHLDREEPKRFTMHERDFSADCNDRTVLDYMHARFYSSSWGRCASVDAGGTWDLHHPRSLNRYAYGLDNPMNFVDRDGKEAIIFIIGASNIVRDMSGAFGHTAIWVSSGNRNDGVSFGGDYAFERNRGYAAFVKAYLASGRSVHVFHLKTTPAQDIKMLQYIQQRPTPFIGFNMCTNNCTTTAVDVLKAGGVIPKTVPVYDGSSGLTQRPNTYTTPEGLEAALDGGELSSIVQSQSTASAIRGTHPDSSSSMSLDDLLERMQMSWLFSDAFGAQLTVGPRK